jgi:GntR family transcriptional regulator/MocR family aminotransferase
MRYRQPLTFAVSVDRDLARPLSRQLAEQICAAVEEGVLPPGMRIPSTRTLAAQLGVSRGVTMEAYELLFRRGYAASRPGSGTYVTVPVRATGSSVPGVGTTKRYVPGSGTAGSPVSGLAAADGGRHPAPVPRPSRPAGHGRPRVTGRDGGDIDLRPGRVSGEALPLAAWRAAWRWASFRPPPTGAPPLGLPELRHAIARHLQHTHGVALAGREVVVTGGAAHGLRAVLAALDLSGPRVAVEEPMAPALWRAAEDGDARPAGVPADGEGARVDLVPQRCRALVLRPDGGVPSGAVLGAGRRAAAAQWSRQPGNFLVEVACDAVLPPAAGLLPRLLSLAAPDASALVGGFCEVLTPALGIGYAVIPRRLAATIARQLRDRSGQPPYVSQLAAARLLDDGTVERVMRRLGRDYQRGGDIVRAASGGTAPGAGPVPGGTGIALLPLPGVDATAVAAHLRGRGVLVSTLAPYHFSAAPVPPALVVGYGHLTEAALRRGVAALGAALPDALAVTAARPAAATRAAA